jgi:transcriptional regulator with XRE-family HTH domain
MDPATLNRLEQGKNSNPSVRTLERVAKELDVGILDLLDPQGQAHHLQVDALQQIRGIADSIDGLISPDNLANRNAEDQQTDIKHARAFLTLLMSGLDSEIEAAKEVRRITTGISVEDESPEDESVGGNPDEGADALADVLRRGRAVLEST